MPSTIIIFVLFWIQNSTSSSSSLPTFFPPFFCCFFFVFVNLVIIITILFFKERDRDPVFCVWKLLFSSRVFLLFVSYFPGGWLDSFLLFPSQSKKLLTFLLIKNLFDFLKKKKGAILPPGKFKLGEGQINRSNTKEISKNNDMGLETSLREFFKWINLKEMGAGKMK